jgi:hypothetical protein
VNAAVPYGCAVVGVALVFDETQLPQVVEETFLNKELTLVYGSAWLENGVLVGGFEVAVRVA